MQAQSEILEHISKLRERLLDLTLRNRLIAFTQSTTGSLRVVDELPDQLLLAHLEITSPEPAARGASYVVFGREPRNGHGERFSRESVPW